MSVISNYAANAMLDSVLADKTVYVGLHISDPGVLGDYGSEVASGDYVRQVVTFSGAGSRTTGNTTLVQFLGMPECSVSHIAIWDSITTGNLISFKELLTPIAVTEGQTFVIPATKIAVTLT